MHSWIHRCRSTFEFSQAFRLHLPSYSSARLMIDHFVLVQFGKGIHFADLVNKGAQYCFTVEENPVGTMLLSEVALGRSMS